MSYFIIIVFSSFLGNPPEILPIAFKSLSDCENHLTKKVINEYNQMHVEDVHLKKYLINYASNTFIACQQLNYPYKIKTDKTKVVIQ